MTAKTKQITAYYCNTCGGELTYEQLMRRISRCVHCGVHSMGNIPSVKCATVTLYRNPRRWQIWKQWIREGTQ